MEKGGAGFNIMDPYPWAPKRVKPYRIHPEHSTRKFRLSACEKNSGWKDDFRKPILYVGIFSCVPGYWHDSRWFLLWRQQRRVQEYHGQSALPWQVGHNFVFSYESSLSDLESDLSRLPVSADFGSRYRPITIALYFIFGPLKEIHKL